MKTRKFIACLLLLAQLIFPLLLTAGVRGEERAAEVRRAQVIAAGEPVLLRLTYLVFERTNGATDRYTLCFNVFSTGYVEPGEHIPLRGGYEGRYYLGKAVKEPPQDANCISYGSYRTELEYPGYQIADADAEALAAAATVEDRNDDWIWFAAPDGEVFLSARLRNGEIAVTGLTVNGTEYPIEKPEK